MKSNVTRTSIALLVIMLALSTLGGDYHRGRSGSNRIQTINDYVYLDGNTIKSTVNSDGVFVDYRLTNASGLEWPIGSGKTAVYSAGLWLVGIHKPTDSLRTAVMYYESEYQPGPLLETFNTQTNADALPVSRAGDPRYRCYKIGFNANRPDDYFQWPGNLGAPFVDANQNGTWDPGVDYPKLVGDQQIWMVVNDVNDALHQSVGTSRPMGVEVRCLYYAFDQPGALGNTMFLKWEIINKSDADYDSVYVSMWSDIDIGGGQNNVPACDSLLNLGYMYEADTLDLIGFGYGNKPPADGFVLLEGPTVAGAPSDSALVDSKWVHGHRNLRMTACTFQTKLGWLPEPAMRDPSYPSEVYEESGGLNWGTHLPVLSATTGQPTTYWLSGDPVAGTGDLPSNFTVSTFTELEGRICVSSGPFSLAHGDTQHVLGAFVIAQGTDRLNSVTLLKQYTADVRSTYRSVHPNPVVSVPSTIPFGYRDLADSPDTLACTIANNTSDTVTITGLTLGGGGPFALVGALPLPLHIAPGGAARQFVSFAPVIRGTFQDSLLIQTSSVVLPSTHVLLTGSAYHINAAVAGTMYGVSVSSLLQVNPSSGGTNQVGSIPGPAGVPPSLAIRPSTRELYALIGSTVCKIDPGSGDTVNVASFPVPGLQCIAFSPSDELFGGTNKGRLYRLSLATGDTLYIGTPLSNQFGGLTFSSGGSLWATFLVGLPRRDKVFRLDPQTGTATLIGMTGDSSFTPSLAFGADGTLYGVKGTGAQVNKLIRIDTVTGAGSVVGSMGVTNVTSIALRTDSLSSGVNEKASGDIPREFGLEQSFPNPFNPTTTIRYSIAVETYYNTPLRVYDVLGREVATLVNEVKPPGSYVVRWDASRCASGMYLCRMTAGKFTATRKLLLLR